MYPSFRKYEEIYPPEVDEFVYITDDSYTKKQLLRMEHLMLKVLSFDMAAPTSHQFLMQYILEGTVCVKTANLALVRLDTLVHLKWVFFFGSGSKLLNPHMGLVCFRTGLT